MIDDFGDEVSRCRYTGEFVWPDFAIVVGATMPAVRARYVIADTDYARAAHRAQGIAFHESEANCNTCAALVRVKRQRSLDGIHHGRCSSPHGQPQSGPYADRTMGDITVFHPDDPMHMRCYVSRWTQIEKRPDPKAEA